MYFLVYVSSAVNLFSDEDLIQLLEVSRRNNEKAEITGLLLYSSGNFMQTLEGPEKAVLETQARILSDPRHTGLITLLQGNREGREFNDWAMGFKRLDGPDRPTIPGYSDFLSNPLRSAEYTANPSRALTLLSFFKNSMR
jgi:hypothetical protein